MGKQKKRMSKQKKIVGMYKLLRAKHYALLIGDTQEDITWAIRTLGKADKSQS